MKIFLLSVFSLFLLTSKLSFTEVFAQLQPDLCERNITYLLDLASKKDRFAPQGLLSAYPLPTPELESKMSRKGIFPWGSGPGFILLSSLAEAMHVDQGTTLNEKGVIVPLLQDRLFRPSYLIPKDEASYRLLLATFRDRPKDQESFDLFFKLSEETDLKIVWFEETDESGEQTPTSFLTKSRPFYTLKDRFDFNEVNIKNSETHIVPLPYYQKFLQERKSILFEQRFKVWTKSPYRGAIVFNDWQDSVTIEKLEKLARSFYKRGMRIKFNKDFFGSLDLLAKQKRKGVGNGLNRQAKDEEREFLIEEYKKGNAFTTEVYYQDDLLAGNISTITDGIVETHSIFYPSFYTEAGEDALQLTKDKNELEKLAFAKKHGLTLAKISFLALRDFLTLYDISFIDAGMVSAFTKSIKGKYILDDEFDNLLNEVRDPNLKLDLDYEWNPGRLP